MKTECEVGITIPLSEVQKRVAEATRVSGRILCRLLKEGENVETGVAMAFSTPRKLRTEVCTRSILDNSDAVLRRTVHNFYLTERQRPTLKAIHSKMCESTGFGGSVSSPFAVSAFLLVSCSPWSRCSTERVPECMHMYAYIRSNLGCVRSVCTFTTIWVLRLELIVGTCVL